MSYMSYSKALGLAIAEEMRRDENVFCLGLDLQYYGGAFGVTTGLCEEFGEKRIVNMPTAIRGLGNDCIRSTGESSRKYEIYVRRRAFGSYGYEAPLRRIRGSRGAAFPYV